MIHRGIRTGAVVATAIVFVACASGDDVADRIEPDAATSTVAIGSADTDATAGGAGTTAAPVDDTAAPADPGTEESTDDAAADAVSDDEAAGAPPDEGPPVNTSPDGLRLLDFAFDEVPAGEYRVETIGAPFTITIPDGWRTQPNFDGHFVITAPDSGGPGDRDIVMIRPSALADPEQPGAPRDEQRGDWPLDDIEGWLDALTPGIVVAGPERTTVGGLDAVRFDVLVGDEYGCGRDFCVGFATNQGINDMWFDRRIGYRVWWIDGGDHSPIAIFIGDGTDPSFTARAEAVLDTMTFESVGPNPIPQDGNLWEAGFNATVPAGTARIPVGPGVEFELSEERFVFQSDRFAGVVLDRNGPDARPGQSDIFFPDGDLDGRPVTDVDDVIAAFAPHDMSAEIVGEREVSGFPTTIVDIAAASGSEGEFSREPVFTSTLDPPNAWWAPPIGTLWVIDAPTGLAIVTAEALDADVYDDARALADEIVDSIVIGTEPG